MIYDPTTKNYYRDQHHQLLAQCLAHVHGRRAEFQAAGYTFMQCVVHEIQAMHKLVNKLRSLQGKGPLELSVIESIEQYCMGSSDYATKFALRCHDAVMDK